MAKKTEEKVQETESTESIELGAEFAALGRSIRDALLSAWSSEQRKDFQDELRSGIQKIADEIDEAAKSMRTSDFGQQVEGKIKQAGEDVRSGKIADDLRESVAKALKATSDAIEEMTSSFTPIDVGEGEAKNGKDK